MDTEEKTILELTPIGTLQGNDKLPIARQGLQEDNNTSVSDIKDFVVSSEEFGGKADKSYVDEAVESLDRNKVEKVPGKVLSSNDYTNQDKTKLDELPTNAELQQQFADVQEQLTFDDVPTEGSNNPVKSGGIKLALDEKYEKPAAGIPRTDFTEEVQEKLEHTLEYEETTDPSDEEMQDEYQRILVPLYQALDDAQDITGKAHEATDGANAAKEAANTAAGTAQSKAVAADIAAAAAAAAADAADAAAEQGKGTYDTLAERLQAIESGKQGTIYDLATIRSNAALAAELVARVAQLESLIGSDSNGAINKFNEIVAFLAGISDTDTLDGIISGLSEAINAKYAKPSGGIPSTDMTSSVQQSLNKADTAVQYEADGDPTDADAENEYNRVLSRLYQALVDARAVTEATNGAILNAYNAQGSAEEAARLATTKAGVAQAAAENAASKAAAADAAAANAQAVMDAAKGDYASLALRLAAMADAILARYTKPDGGIPITDLHIGVAQSLDKADSAYQLPNGGIPKTDMTLDVQTSLGKADSAVQPQGLIGFLTMEPSSDPGSLLE